MASIGELFVELGIVADVKQGKQVDELLDKLSKKSVKTTEGMESLNKAFNNFKKAIGLTAIVTAVRQLDSLTKSLVQSNQAMLNLTRTSDISLDTFQKWGSVGKLFGIQNAAQQMAGLNERLFELKLTGQGARGFQLAGINPMGTDAQGVLEQLRNRVSGVDDTTASYLLKQLGLDPSMLHILKLGREEFENLWKTINRYQLNDDQRKEIQKLNIQLQIAATKLQYLKDRAILAIMPAWSALVEGFAKAIEALKDFVKWLKNGDTWGAKITGIILGITAAVKYLIPAVRALWGILNANPFTLILLALYLIADEIQTFRSGGESLIGYVVDWWEEFSEKFKDFKLPDFETPKWLKDIIEAGKMASELMKLKSLDVPGKNNSFRDMLKSLPTFPGILPMSALVPATIPQNRIITNNNNNDNGITMTNYITSNSPVDSIMNGLSFVRDTQAFQLVGH